MNSLVALTLFVTAVAADRLENTYLPPLRARTSGGSNFLSAPAKSFSAPSYSAPTYSAPTNSYIPPASGPVSSGQYNSPSFRSTGTPVAILKLNNDNNGDGTYRFEYETENHISQQESGQLKNVGGAEPSSSVQGSYSYTAPDGKTYTVNYIADENGFRASGDHIPTPPPVPAAIQKSLQFNAAAAGGHSSSGFSSGSINRQYLAPKAPQAGGYRY